MSAFIDKLSIIFDEFSYLLLKLKLKQNGHFIFNCYVFYVTLFVTSVVYGNCYYFLFFMKLLSTINQMRSDNDQTQLQYQQYNTNVQRHIQELNEQVRIDCLSYFSLFKIFFEFRSIN